MHFDKKLFNIPNLELDTQYSDFCKCNSITTFNKPLTENEMKYFNHSIENIYSLIRQYKSCLFSSNLQSFCFGKINDLNEINDFITDTVLNNLVRDFNSKFNFNSISNEKILFLLTYLSFPFFEKENFKFDLIAKNGCIYLDYESLNYYPPRVRERISMVLSIFFDENKNIFNGLLSNDKVAIEPREYFTSLNVINDTMKWSYLMSNKRSISIDNILGVKDFFKIVTSINDIDSFKEKFMDFFFKDIPYENIKSEFNSLKFFKFSHNDKNTISLLKIMEKTSLRYDFFSGKFISLFSNIKREKELLEIISNTDIKEIKKVKSKI